MACLVASACLPFSRAPPAGAAVTLLAALLREPATRHITLPNGKRADLEALVTRPARPPLSSLWLYSMRDNCIGQAVGWQIFDADTGAGANGSQSLPFVARGVLPIA
jgi:hypothetical protein